MYRFEWNFKSIKDQKSFEQFCEDMLKEDNPYFKLPANYEQAARLFYQHDNGECVMIELQVPTYLKSKNTKQYFALHKYLLQSKRQYIYSKIITVG